MLHTLAFAQYGSIEINTIALLVQVSAVAYDNPIPGFKTDNTINLRLWAAKPDKEFDLEAFNTGDYVQVCLFQGLQIHVILPAFICTWNCIL